MPFMLSLATNPHDPFEEYDLWLRFDHKEGFDTAGLMARLMSTSEAISDADQELAQSDAIDSILQNPSFRGLYKKVERGKSTS